MNNNKYEYEKVLSDIKNLQIINDGIREINEKLQKNVMNFIYIIKKLKLDYECIQEQNSAFQGQISTLQEQNAAFQGQIPTLQTNNNQFQKEISDLKKSITSEKQKK